MATDKKIIAQATFSACTLYNLADLIPSSNSQSSKSGSGKCNKSKAVAIFKKSYNQITIDKFKNVNYNAGSSHNGATTTTAKPKTTAGKSRNGRAIEDYYGSYPYMILQLLSQYVNTAMVKTVVTDTQDVVCMAAAFLRGVSPSFI